MSNIGQLSEAVQTVNGLIDRINKNLASNARTQQDPQEFKKQVDVVKKTLEKATEAPAVKPPKPPEKTFKETPKEDYSVTQIWGDPRYNPAFLRVAEYFGIDHREYPMAVNKISTIVDWAANETKSKNIGDIMSKIGNTSRELPSPGYGEKRYAILYRFVKLSSQKHEIEKEMEAYKKA